MKKLLLSLLILIGFNAKSQIVLFEDSFEFYNDFDIANVGDWTLTDVDLKLTYGFQGITFTNSGVAKSFQVFNATTTTPALAPTATSNWTARTGDRHMVCFAASQPTAAPLNNDWLISPQISLGASGNVLKFWAKSCDSGFGLERFKVGVSTTDTATGNFTVISAAPYITTPANATWVEYTYNLDQYADMSVYISINCISNDQFGFAVDDFSVTATTLGTQSFFTQNYQVYPNPADNVLNVASKNNTSLNQIQMVDLNGRTVKSIDAKDASSTQLNISDLTSGAYFLKITNNQGTATTKIIKK